MSISTILMKDQMAPWFELSSMNANVPLLISLHDNMEASRTLIGTRLTY